MTKGRFNRNTEENVKHDDEIESHLSSDIEKKPKEF